MHAFRRFRTYPLLALVVTLSVLISGLGPVQAAPPQDSNSRPLPYAIGGQQLISSGIGCVGGTQPITYGDVTTTGNAVALVVQLPSSFDGNDISLQGRQSNCVPATGATVLAADTSAHGAASANSYVCFYSSGYSGACVAADVLGSHVNVGANWNSAGQGAGTYEAIFKFNQGATAGQTLKIWMIYDVAPSATPTNTAPPTNTPTPTSTPAAGNLLRDGNMEANPNTAWSFMYNPFEDGVYARRLYPGTNIVTRLTYGSAACSSGMQLLGYTNDFLSSHRLNPMGQLFDWTGGTMNLRYAVRGRGNQNGGMIKFHPYIETEDGTSLYPLATVDVTSSWSVYTDTLASMPAGTYRLVFDMVGEDNDRDAQILLDDVALGGGAQSSHCSSSGATPTPNLTRTPTPTRTPTASPTTGPIAITNCSFESGTLGWNFFGSSRLGTPGGPSGATYAIADPDITQRFNWPGGALYVQLFVRGPVRVQIGEGILGASPVTIIDQNYANWTLVQRVVVRPAGINRLRLSRGASTSSATASFDGVQLSAGGYVAQVCTAPTSTPTSSPTSGASPTLRATRTPGPSPTVSVTPRGTRTPNPSLTPQSTYTPRPSSTPRPTSTQNDPEKTATAQGTPVATYTPYPTYTPGAGGGGGGGGTCDTSTQDCPVPPQPEPGPFADCERPIYFWQVAQWVDYTRCSVLSYFAWSETNSEQLIALGAEAENYEPFGTVAEAVEAVEAVNLVIGEYDWVDTGYTGYFEAERPELLTLSLSALADPMDFSLDAGAYAIVQLEITFCRGRLVTVFSTNVAHGVCVVWAFLHSTGIIAWIQFFFDLACWWVLVRYIWKRFLG